MQPTPHYLRLNNIDPFSSHPHEGQHSISQMTANHQLMLSYFSSKETPASSPTFHTTPPTAPSSLIQAASITYPGLWLDFQHKCLLMLQAMHHHRTPPSPTPSPPVIASSPHPPPPLQLTPPLPSPPISSSKPPRFRCDRCQRCYSTRTGLQKHRNQHCSSSTSANNDRATTSCFYSCQHCTKLYHSMSALKMHIRTHTLPCKCNLCGKAFSRMWLLNGHLRTHTGEKPFQCAVCERAFADRSNLRAHMQTHSAVKRYHCERCKRTFSRMGLLTKHQAGIGGCSSGEEATAPKSPACN